MNWITVIQKFTSSLLLLPAKRILVYHTVRLENKGKVTLSQNPAHEIFNKTSCPTLADGKTRVDTTTV